MGWSALYDNAGRGLARRLTRYCSRQTRVERRSDAPMQGDERAYRKLIAPRRGMLPTERAVLAPGDSDALTCAPSSFQEASVLRRTLAHKEVGAREGFRWRGHEITRIEALTDAVFAFAITLLVVSLEVPRTFTELAETMRGFLAFALSFAMLFWIWYQHFIFFRRYGLQDSTTVVLSGILLFVVLFYVYPLKFLWSLLASTVMGGGTLRGADGTTVPMIEQSQMSSLLAIYGLGFAAVFLLFLLLYLHAHRRRESLGLTALEAYDTREKAREHGLSAGVGLLSVALTLLFPRVAAIAVMPYWLLGAVQAVHGRMSRRRRDALATASGVAGPAAVTEPG